jgi:poly(beta-D-mannuronate) C5 epimerase
VFVMVSGAATRRTWSLGLSLVLWVALVAAGVALATTRHHAAAPGGRLVARALTFSHVYPQDPVPFERPAVGTASPSVVSSQRVRQGARLTSLAQLAAATPRGTLARTGAGTWRLARPVELTARTSLVLRGPVRLELGPGAFLLAERRAVVRLTDLTVVGVDGAGRPATTPTVDRGFLAARSGAVLVLRNDTLVDLGHLGQQAYGVTADDASSAFSMTGCTVRNDYFGVYLARLTGGVVAHDRFVDPVIYGIDPHTSDSNLRIVDNVVAGAGVHGIVLADLVTHSLVARNVVAEARDHGIVVFQSSDDNVLRDNVVRDVFDGIVISSSSGNQVVGNRIGPVVRFGVRVSGASTGNVVLGNTVAHAQLGAYLYDGASHNQLVNNRFAHNYENVRVRRDAPSNTVVPDPGRSEL